MGNVNIWESRRTCYESVAFWKRDESSVLSTSDYIHERKPSGEFYAKEVNSEYLSSQIVSSSFMFDDSSIMIETRDDVAELSNNDIVKYDERPWNVVSIQRKKLLKRSGMSKVPTYRTFITLKC